LGALKNQRERGTFSRFQRRPEKKIPVRVQAGKVSAKEEVTSEEANRIKEKAGKAFEDLDGK
jgi:hypothetical protein